MQDRDENVILESEPIGDIVFCSVVVYGKTQRSTGELRVPAGIGAQLTVHIQHGHTGDAVISTYDDAVGTLLCLGSNFYYNISGSKCTIHLKNLLAL